MQTFSTKQESIMLAVFHDLVDENMLSLELFFGLWAGY